MGLKAKVETLDDVDSQYHDLYEPSGGGFVLKPIEGMKPQEEFDRVHRGLASEREDHRGTKGKLKALEDLGIKGPEDVSAIKTQLTELDTALAASSDGQKVEALVQQRTRAAVGPLERELQNLRTQNSDLTKHVGEFREKEVKSRIREAITSAARREKVLDTAIDDAVTIGENLFEVDSAGNVVTRDVRGLTPGLDAEAWLSDLRTKKTHWWPQSQGGGAGGSGAGGASGPNPWSKGEWNLTKQGQMLRSNRAQAERLAKLAGSYIGATQPPAK